MPNHAREMVSKRNERAGIGAVRRFLPTMGFAVLAHACQTPPDPAAEPVSGNDPVSPLAAAAASVEAADFAARIGFLADDLMRGRATPSNELDLAARYIASEFAVFGLEPGGDD